MLSVHIYSNLTLVPLATELVVMSRVELLLALHAYFISEGGVLVVGLPLAGRAYVVLYKKRLAHELRSFLGVGTYGMENCLNYL